MTSNSRALKTFQDIRKLMESIKCNKKYCHTFAFLARVWKCEEKYVRDLQLSARGISEKRFHLVRMEVERILEAEHSHRDGGIINSTPSPIKPAAVSA